MLEPEDEILIPRGRSKNEAARMRTRHAVRALAVLLIIFSVVYGYICYQLNRGASQNRGAADMLGIIPGIVFGLCLWWYAGRKSSNLHHPIFHRPADGAPALSLARMAGLVVGMVTGLLGLAAVTYGATIRWHGEELRTVVWSSGGVSHNVIWVPEDSAHWGTVSMEAGVVLILVALAALYLARNKAAPPTLHEQPVPHA